MRETWTPGDCTAGLGSGNTSAVPRNREIDALVPVPGSAYTRPVKMIVAVVHNEDARVLVDALLSHRFRATWLHTSGGFLKQSNATILVGVDDAQIDEVVSIVRENCRARSQTVSPIPPIMEPGEFFMPYPIEVEVGGAVIFVLPIERFERI